MVSTAAAAPLVPGNWTSSWSDEFNVGNSDLNGWVREIGGGGWGNNELETYSSSSSNAFVSGGDLTIRAIASTSAGKQSYSSARITTSGLFSQTNGLIEFSAKMPAGTGLWPAVWMMPQNSSYGGWPRSGEIDMFESKGQDTSLVQGSLHSGADSGSQYTQTATLAGSGKKPAGFSTTAWHTYDVEWDAGTATNAATFKWFVDGTLYQTVHGGWYTPDSNNKSSPFDKPFYFIINMAVGGDYVGTPALADGNYDMQLDYLRAYTGTAPEPAALGSFALFALLLRRHRDATA